MARVEVMVDIKAPPEKVFERLVKFEEHPKWVKNVQSAKQTTAGPAAVGTRFSQAVKFMGRTMAIEGEIAELQANRHMLWKVSGPVTGTMSWDLTPEGQGTRLRSVLSPEKMPGLLSLLGPITTMQMKSAHRGNIENLKRILESGG